MWGDHSRREYNSIMLGIGSLFILIMLGEVFPIIETLMNIFVISLFGCGIVIFLANLISEERKMYHSLHDPVEKLIEEDRKNDYTE